MSRNLFIFGLGYSALAFAQLAQHAGIAVSGTTRSEDKRAKLRGLGIAAYVWDDVPERAIAEADFLLSSVPSDPEKGDSVLSLWGGRLALLPREHSWVGYLSTTGVYGDHQGAWVDEESELRPNNPRLQRRVEAEARWRELGAHIFRLSGIYGPGRNALVDVQEGTARRIDKPGQVFSRIHRDDIAGVLWASCQKPNPGRVYNVCDNEPAPAPEVIAYATSLLGIEPPPLIPFEKATFSPMAKEFYSANRRVSNARIREELGYTMHYPTYREGLSALARNMLD